MQTALVVCLLQTSEALALSQSQHASLQAEHGRLKQELEQQAAALAAAHDAQRSLRSELDATHAALERAQATAAHLEHEHDLEAKVEIYKAESAKMQAEIRRLSVAADEAAAAQQRAEALQRLHAGVTAELEGARADLQRANAELARLSSELDAARAAAEQQMQQVRSVAESGSEAAGRAEALQGQLDAATAELGSMREQLVTAAAENEAGEAERERLRNQLARLKAQMITEQEEEEDKVTWRVEAEVKAAEEKHSAVVAAMKQDHAAAVAALKAELEAAKAQLARLKTDADGEPIIHYLVASVSVCPVLSCRGQAGGGLNRCLRKWRRRDGKGRVVGACGYRCWG